MLMFFCSVEERRVAITAEMHVDYMFAVGRKSRCGHVCEPPLVQWLPIYQGPAERLAEDFGEDLRLSVIGNVWCS